MFLHLSLKTIRTTFWTRYDHTIRSDEIQEEEEMKAIDAEEQKHRTNRHDEHMGDSALWTKHNDTVFLKDSTGDPHFFISFFLSFVFWPSCHFVFLPSCHFVFLSSVIVSIDFGSVVTMYLRKKHWERVWNTNRRKCECWWKITRN